MSRVSFEVDEILYIPVERTNQAELGFFTIKPTLPGEYCNAIPYGSKYAYYSTGGAMLGRMSSFGEEHLNGTFRQTGALTTKELEAILSGATEEGN